MDRLTRWLSFSGRSSRLVYWRVQVVSLLLYAVILLATVYAAQLGQIPAAIVFLPIVPLLIANAAVLVRRLHDRGKASWWLIPFLVLPMLFNAAADALADSDLLAAAGLGLAGLGLSIWGLVEIGFLRGAAGSNRFGDEPAPMRRR